MIIEKVIVSKILRDYFFITGIFDIDARYFKKRIEEGVQNSNINYKTNVVGKHTEWTFFNKDEQFKILLLQMIDHLEGLSTPTASFHLSESWGIIEKFGDYTKPHDHGSSYLSGVLYINDHPQKLYFPTINQEIIPKKGRFVIFSSFLTHHTLRNLKQKEKYAISFNFSSTNVGDLKLNG
jgi:hypothetical protein|tara:strand:+ start:387 stop:926 length:540 start_codon:yes stop_codon:yes gene_type:complete